MSFTKTEAAAIFAVLTDRLRTDHGIDTSQWVIEIMGGRHLYITDRATRPPGAGADTPGRKVVHLGETWNQAGASLQHMVDTVQVIWAEKERMR